MPNPVRWCVLTAVILGLAVPLLADDVERGIDLWKTPPGSGTKTDLDLPRGFFDMGSLAVKKRITLRGEPVETMPGTPSLGNADTVLERLATARPVTCGEPDRVGLRIAALHLIGEAPLTVRYEGSSQEEQWTVEVYLSDANQQVGMITIDQDCEDGGTFVSSFTVRPKLVFTRTGDGEQRFLDWVMRPDLVPEVPLRGRGPWSRRRPNGSELTTAAPGAVVDANHDGIWEEDDPLPGSTADFVVGAEPRPCLCGQPARDFAAVAIEETAAETAANHIVHPPTYDRASFPLRRRGDRPAIPRSAKASSSPRSLSFIPLALLALAVGATIPWRRG